MLDCLTKESLDLMLETYESTVRNGSVQNQSCPVLQAKLKTIKDIKHRILVLSKGGLTLINTKGD